MMNAQQPLLYVLFHKCSQEIYPFLSLLKKLLFTLMQLHTKRFICRELCSTFSELAVCQRKTQLFAAIVAFLGLYPLQT